MHPETALASATRIAVGKAIDEAVRLKRFERIVAVCIQFPQTQESETEAPERGSTS